MSNVIDLSAFKGVRPPERDFTGQKHAMVEPRVAKCWHHRLVFRSYDLLAKSGEAELVRDVRLDTGKAVTKLRKIREQIVIDRDRAAARAEMMSKAEAKLSAAIAAAAETPEQPPAKYDPARRRDFYEAMRKRINIVALLRGLSVEEIKPVLTLKHSQIAKFTEERGVNLEWLLEGRGRVFNNEPANSNRSPAELAALVHTMPEAQQRKIEAVVDFLLEEQSI
jgi:DNA-binding transcriptional MerR regulator